jgi:hypothetical protein
MVRELSPQTRVIYSSGFTADALAARSMRLNGGALLRKPFRRAEFCSAVLEAMVERRAEPRDATSLIHERGRGLRDR